MLKELVSRKASGLLSIGDFYRKQKKYEAAAIYYRRLIEDYPESPEAKTAGSRIQSLKLPGTAPVTAEQEAS